MGLTWFCLWFPWRPHMGPSAVHWLEMINKQRKSSCRDLEEPEPEPGQPLELVQEAEPPVGSQEVLKF